MLMVRVIATSLVINVFHLDLIIYTYGLLS